MTDCEARNCGQSAEWLVEDTGRTYCDDCASELASVLIDGLPVEPLR